MTPINRYSWDKERRKIRTPDNPVRCTSVVAAASMSVIHPVLQEIAMFPYILRIVGCTGPSMALPEQALTATRISVLNPRREAN
jgi:hypothetical protein